MMRKIIAAAGLVALSAVAAHAATATGNLSVSVTITASCAVTNGTLSFGSNAASALSAKLGTGEGAAAPNERNPAKTAPAENRQERKREERCMMKARWMAACRQN